MYIKNFFKPENVKKIQVLADGLLNISRLYYGAAKKTNATLH